MAVVIHAGGNVAPESHTRRHGLDLARRHLCARRHSLGSGCGFAGDRLRAAAAQQVMREAA